MLFELASIEFDVNAALPAGTTPALVVTVLLIAVTAIKLLKECHNLWGEWFFPATTASVRVTVGSEPEIEHPEPAAKAGQLLDAAQRQPPIPVIQWSPRPKPVLRQEGSPSCVHVFALRAKNASGYNYMCHSCGQHWYRPWAEEEKHIQIKDRLCTAQVVTEVSLTDSRVKFG